MTEPTYPMPISDAAGQMWLDAGLPVPWRQNWLNGEEVPRGAGGILDKCDLFEAGDTTVFQRPWTARERARLAALATR